MTGEHNSRPKRAPAVESDLARARRAASGDSDAMADLLSAHFDYVHTLCRRIMRDPVDTEDARQEALLLAVRHIRDFSGRSSFRTWLHTITVRTCLNALRARNRLPLPIDPDVRGSGPDGGSLDATLARLDIDAALARLVEPYRTTVVLRYVCDLEYQEIANMLDVPVNTVRSRLSRGRGELARLVGNLSA